MISEPISQMTGAYYKVSGQGSIYSTCAGVGRCPERWCGSYHLPGTLHHILEFQV